MSGGGGLGQLHLHDEDRQDGQDDDEDGQDGQDDDDAMTMMIMTGDDDEGHEEEKDGILNGHP